MGKFLSLLIVSMAAMLWTSVVALAQNAVVKGKVTDIDGEPLPAVVVYEEGNQMNGTATDNDGNFSITISESGKLVFSCLGYEDLVRSVPKKGGTITVRMEASDLRLDAAEIVETGFGSIAKRDLTGSVASADMSSTLKTSNFSFDQGLIGRIAGVDVTTADGELGADASIIIRGNNSLTQSNEPLYVIDGFPSEASMASSLNMDDIESIDVLKDASATALYGAQGANGVIVITTKTGVSERPRVTFKASWQGSQIVNKAKLLNGTEYVQLEIDQGSSTYTSHDGGFGNVTHYTIDQYEDAETIDFQDYVFRKALTQKYSVSLIGGNKATGTNYTASFSAVDQDGILVASYYERYQGRIKFTQKIGKKVDVTINANFSRAIVHGTTPTDYMDNTKASGWLMYSIWGYRPVRPLWDTTTNDQLLNQAFDEELNASTDYRFNPLLTLKNEYRKRADNNLTGQATINYRIIPELVFRARGNYRYRDRRQEAFNGSETRTGWEGSSTGYGPNGSIYWTKWESWGNEESLTWTKNIRSEHHISLQGVFSMSGETNDYYGMRATQIESEELGLLGMSTGQFQNVNFHQYDWRLMSGMVQFQYNYMHKYLLTASFRADGSSRFSSGTRWGYFPSAAFAWSFVKEKAIERGAPWLTNGKLRLSWGTTGNNRTTTPYDYYAIITSVTGSTSSRDYIVDGQRVTGYYPSNMENDGLKWETTEQYDIGLDLSFLRGKRINLTADFYIKNTRNLLLNADIPGSSGFTTAMLNIGSMRNTGVELTLETVNFNKKNFQWTTSFNIAFNRNVVTGLSRGEDFLYSSVSWDSVWNSEYAYVTQVGKPTGMLYGYIYEGTYKAEDFEHNGLGILKAGIPYMEGVGRENVLPGDCKYKDINGDGVIDENDMTIIGRGQPIHTGGFNNTFTFFGVDINIFFSWRYGNDVINANRYIFESGLRSHLNQFKSYADRYDYYANPNSDIPAVGAHGLEVYSSRVVEDGSFLKLRNVSVGYTFPSKIFGKAKINNLRVYVSADNIWTITKYSGIDPETSIFNSVLTPGFDWSAYPRAFGVTGGFSVTF